MSSADRHGVDSPGIVAPVELVAPATGNVAPIDLADATGRLAAAGYLLLRLAGADGGVEYLVSRWGLARHVGDADGLRAFAKRLGVTL